MQVKLWDWNAPRNSFWRFVWIFLLFDELSVRKFNIQILILQSESTLENSADSAFQRTNFNDLIARVVINMF